MNVGKNRMRLGVSPLNGEILNSRVIIEQVYRPLSLKEKKHYNIGFLQYYQPSWLLSIALPEGEVISGETFYSSGIRTSNEVAIQHIENQITTSNPLYTSSELDRMSSILDLMSITTGVILTPLEWTQFKQIYHAIAREDFALVNKIYSGYDLVPPFHPKPLYVA